MAKGHSLLGILYASFEKLPKNQRPPKTMLLQWYMIAQQIVQKNEILNYKVLEISNMFSKDNFQNVVLKGQGIAKYYEVSNLDKYRTPGDIDIWFNASREDIILYARKHLPDGKIVYHHVDFPSIDGVDIEIHFTPSWMNSYFTNKKLQHFFDIQKSLIFNDYSSYNSSTIIPTPTLEFNQVYILVHIYRHLFLEGIGLRQLMDYYFVLKQGINEKQRENAVRILSSFNMLKFTSAVMWVLHQVFGMEEDYYLVPPNTKEGKFLLDEILKSGNFGKVDKRLVYKNRNNFLYGLYKIKHNFRFMFNYPSEVLWSPFFKTWHFIWRSKYN
jgi:hypothetical protein